MILPKIILLVVSILYEDIKIILTGGGSSLMPKIGSCCVSDFRELLKIGSAVEVLRQMRDAGFSRLNLALVSSEPKVLKGVDRPHHVENLIDVVDVAFSLGFELEVHQIIGLPNESITSMTKTLAFLAQLPVLIGVSIFYLTPGTEIAKFFPDMDENDIFRSRSTAMAYPSDECDRDDLFTLFTTARIINFLKGIQFDRPKIQLSELFQQEREKSRFGAAIIVLNRLLSEKKFFTFHKGTFKEHTRFKYATFKKVWKNRDTIITQKNETILLR